MYRVYGRKETARTLFLSFTHGYPGHEKNLDLAQSLRRTGFSSVIFFYRGCWGSEGDFSFEGSFEDTKAVLDFVLNDTQYGFDKNHIFFIGHSLGCVNAARMIALCPQVKGGCILSPLRSVAYLSSWT